MISTPVTATNFKVRCRERNNTESGSLLSSCRSWLEQLLIPFITVTAAYLSSSYFEYFNNALIVCVGILSWLMYHAFIMQTLIRDVEIIVNISPLGIQRSKRITTTRIKKSILVSTINNPKQVLIDNNNKKNNEQISVHCYPLLPLESVQDCILVEHVGVFSVTTHAMIRSNNGEHKSHDNTSVTNSIKKNAKKSSELIPVFPNASLSFARCHLFVTMINNVLKDYKKS